jgi:flavin-dependent dehydrogenase
MSKILVAGAGHGGLVAAARLAGAGFDVTVIEKGKEGKQGHDWEDRFTFKILCDALGIPESGLGADIWRYRGDCAFVSPAKRKKVIINYTDENRQRIMWRKPLIKMLIENAVKSGVKFIYETEVLSPLTQGSRVTGLRTDKGDYDADLVIDAAGVFSPVRSNLPASFGIEKEPKEGDVFYAYRAYFDKAEDVNPEVPFEVYMYHEGEKGLSWFNTIGDCCDVLIGRVFPLTDEKINEQLAIFGKDHPWLGDKILHGGCRAVIPVRRPLTLMVADGYAAVGDSAFMTTPMNGMGIDLSILAGGMLADTLIEKADFSAENLWNYNRNFHALYGGDTAKNEGLKNAILSLPSEGVDFLFENEVIQSSDLAGAGKNMNFGVLLGKLKRGMRSPGFFFALIKGLVAGSGACKLYKSAPENYSPAQIRAWSDKIAKKDIAVKSE